MEIHVHPHGACVACYDGAADVAYEDLGALLSAHFVDEEEFLAVLDARVRAEIATSVPQETSEAAP